VRAQQLELSDDHDAFLSSGETCIDLKNRTA